ncbi:hypothetical protein D9O40_17015 [Clostridium autoethanogenum]|uniref:Immunity protein Imm6 n=1 Tax=Clostridium autoethanogenum TaxID=84023 RepID=A0A3M0SAZ4_9CLOT|nr:Imm6 family immunity protein [Clostridium autoethanogenum]RMC94784.1 hypothetical protein D9O40_17015 [Clostridium autoethanogenum]
MSRKEILDKLILGKTIDPNVAEALKNNLDFGDLLIYFSNASNAYCLVNGFCYAIRLDGKPIIWERYKMKKELFLKHAENFSNNYFEPKQELLLKIPKIMSEFLAPLKWIESNIEMLSDIELGSILVRIGEMLLEEIKQKKNEASKLSDDSLWVEVVERTLKVCKEFVQGEGVTVDEIYPLLDSEDCSDIVELSCQVEDNNVILLIGHISNITSYILTLAIYKEYGEHCPLPEILDSFQGEDMPEMFIKFLLYMIQDKLINKEKFQLLG